MPDGAEVSAYLDGLDDAPATIVWFTGCPSSPTCGDCTPGHSPTRACESCATTSAHSRSTRGTARITLELLAYDLARIIERLAPHGPLLLAGHSMGGMILQTLTTLRPDLLPHVHGLLLISTPDGPVTTRPQPGPRSRVLGWGRGLLAAVCTGTPTTVDAIRHRLPHSSPRALNITEFPP